MWNNIIWKHGTFAVSPTHSLRISDKHRWISAQPSSLSQKVSCSRQTVGIYRLFIGCASSRHDICACAHRRRPLQPLLSCFSRLAPPLLEGEGSHLQRPTSDVFYPRFAEVRVVRGGSMICELLCSSSSQIQWPRSITSSAVVVFFFLRPLTRRSRPALEGPHGGRHLSVSADLRRVRADSAEPPETLLHEGGAPEQDVARGVRLLAAHGAPRPAGQSMRNTSSVRTHAFLCRAAAAGISRYWITCTARTHIYRFWRATIASSTDSGWPK